MLCVVSHFEHLPDFANLLPVQIAWRNICKVPNPNSTPNPKKVKVHSHETVHWGLCVEDEHKRCRSLLDRKGKIAAVTWRV